MANSNYSKSNGLISKEYTNPVDAMSSKIFNIFDIYRVNPQLNNEESIQIVLLFVSLYKDELISYEITKNNFNFSNLKNSISESTLNEDSKKTYLSIIDVLYNSLSNVINQTQDYLGHYLFQIEKDLLNEYFPAIFDDTIYRIAQSQGRYSAEYLLPIELSRFMSGLIDFKPNSSVFNPFGGIASFGISLNNQQSYLGQEINQNTWILGVLRLMAYGKLTNSHFERADSIKLWPVDTKFDFIVSNPPFGLRLDFFDTLSNKNYKTCDHFLIEKGMQTLKSQGKLIATFSQGILFKGGRELELRKQLVDKGLIETIISFPGGLFNFTSIPFIIMVLSKEKKFLNKIRLIKADDFVIEKNKREKTLLDELLLNIYNSDIEYSNDLRWINSELIRENDYNLNVNRYFNDTKSDNTIPDGAEQVVLGDVVNSFVKSFNNNQKGKVISISNLAESIDSYEKQVSDFDYGNIPISSQKIDSSAILLSRVRNLKPTYCKLNEGEIVYCTNNIIPLLVDETKVYIPYLILELNSDRVTKFVKSRLTGISIPTLSKKDILEIPILLYSLEVQKAKFDGYIEAIAQKKKEELISFSKIHGLKKEAFEQNTYLRHTLAGPTSNLISSLAHIKSIIFNKIAPIYPEILSQKISEDHLFSLADYLDIVERDANKIYETVKQQLKVDNIFDSKLLSPINIVDFLKTFVAEKSENNNLDYKIDLDFDKESFWDDNTETEIKTMVSANVDLLSDLFNNLIENAVKHAFNKGIKNRIEVYVMQDVLTESKPEIQILFSNTGKPFPENFGYDKYIRKGSKAGRNAGDGYGGWYVNEIIKYHNGTFDIIDETGAEGLPDTDLATSFEINFPIIEIDE